MKSKSIFLLLLYFLFLSSCRKSNYEVPYEEVIIYNGAGTGTVTWTSDQDYVLEGLVFVNEGQTLTIEPGTVIRAKTGQAENASALIVARGGKIIAQGTATNPIIFTVEGDNLKGSIPIESQGLWGGLILLGNAPLNVSGNEAIIEGIPINEPRGLYGGDDPDDNSGILQYVSIRHGGTNIGEGNEINGLTLGGVGSGTTIDHIEVISNADDGIEFFGGTVNCKYIAVAYCGDDAFDFDMGYQGKGQYWLAIQGENQGNLVAELDGSPSHPSAKPYTMPQIYNLTALGHGTSKAGELISFRTNAAGSFINSIFVNQENGIELEYNKETSNSLEQWQRGNIKLEGNTFFNIANNEAQHIFKITGDEPETSVQNEWQNYFESASNLVANPNFIALDPPYNLYPTSELSSPVIPGDDFFDQVDYRGAFKNQNWLLGWSLLSREGIIDMP
ncbi:MAG: hypothetical protein JW857_10060 [Bacteroidales bacterium]|nr:hypothetical protein [Bacteroidales bacterium]